MANQPSDFDGYLLKKGRHWSRRMLRLQINRKRLAFEAIFEINCIYQPNLNPDQINKLYGMSFGLHHRSSARIGWRSDGENIELLSYVYVRPGIFSHKSFGMIKAGEKVKLEIVREAKTVTLIFNDAVTHTYQLEKASFWGYMLYPFFGGPEKAPHNMYIFIKEI